MMYCFFGCPTRKWVLSRCATHGALFKSTQGASSADGAREKAETRGIRISRGAVGLHNARCILTAATGLFTAAALCCTPRHAHINSTHHDCATRKYSHIMCHRPMYWHSYWAYCNSWLVMMIPDADASAGVFFSVVFRRQHKIWSLLCWTRRTLRPRPRWARRLRRARRYRPRRSRRRNGGRSCCNKRKSWRRSRRTCTVKCMKHHETNWNLVSFTNIFCKGNIG